MFKEACRIALDYLASCKHCTSMVQRGNIGVRSHAISDRLVSQIFHTIGDVHHEIPRFNNAHQRAVFCILRSLYILYICCSPVLRPPFTFCNLLHLIPSILDSVGLFYPLIFCCQHPLFLPSAQTVCVTELICP